MNKLKHFPWIITVSLFCRKVFEVLELMKLDMANFTLLQARPLIQQHAAEYERTKFEEFLKTQSGGHLLYMSAAQRGGF